jgi:hypothetical protein
VRTSEAGDAQAAINPLPGLVSGVFLCPQEVEVITKALKHGPWRRSFHVTSRQEDASMTKANIVPINPEQEILDRRFERPNDVAKRFRISASEVYRSIYAGELRAFKYKSRVWLIAVEDADAWIAENSKPNVA